MVSWLAAMCPHITNLLFFNDTKQFPTGNKFRLPWRSLPHEPAHGTTVIGRGRATSRRGFRGAGVFATQGTNVGTRAGQGKRLLFCLGLEISDTKQWVGLEISLEDAPSMGNVKLADWRCASRCPGGRLCNMVGSSWTSYRPRRSGGRQR